MKVYDYQWSTSFGMNAETAAAELVRDGVDTVLIRNQIDPLADLRSRSGLAYLASGAAVSAGRVIAPGRTRCARPALRVYQTTALFFDPDLLQSFPGRATGRRDRRTSRGIRLVPGRLPDARRLSGSQDRPLAAGRRRAGAGRPLSLVHALPRVLGELGCRTTASPTPIASASAPVVAPASSANSASTLLRGDAAAQARVILRRACGAVGRLARSGGSSRRSTRIASAVTAGRAGFPRSCSTRCPFPPSDLRRRSTCGGTSRRRIWRCCAMSSTASS